MKLNTDGPKKAKPNTQGIWGTIEEVRKNYMDTFYRLFRNLLHVEWIQIYKVHFDVYMTDSEMESRLLIKIPKSVIGASWLDELTRMCHTQFGYLSK